jgi:proteasome lid subunit RPN8/RPN11
MVEHARAGAPDEVCGVLGGNRGEGEEPSTVRRALRATNAAETPRTRYALDPAEQLTRMQEIEDAGESVVGFYHSHPRGPPEPSGVDEARATWPGYSYVIVVLDGPDSEPFVGSWRWTGERFTPERVALA